MRTIFASVMKKRHQDENLDTLIKSTIIFTLKVAAAFAGFLLTLILSRSMPLADLGFALRSLSIAFFIGAFCSINIEGGAIRYMLQPLAKEHYNLASGFLNYSQKVFFKSAPFAALLTFLLILAPDVLSRQIVSEKTISTILMALSVPVLGWVKLTGAWGVSVQRVVTVNFFSHFLRSILTTMIIVAVFWYGRPISILELSIVHFFACCVCMVGQNVFLNADLVSIKKTNPSYENKKTWIRTGMYLLVAALPYDYLQNLVVTVAAFSMSDNEVGLLAVIFRFIPLLSIGLAALNATSDPKIADAIAREDFENATSIVHFTNLLKFLPTIFLTIFIWVYADWIMLVFGQHFADAAWGLRLISLSPCVIVFFGPSILILNAIGEQKSIFILSAWTTIALIFSVLLFGGIFGITSAVASVVTCIAIWEWFLYRKVLEKTGINIGILASIKTALNSRSALSIKKL